MDLVIQNPPGGRYWESHYCPNCEKETEHIRNQDWMMVCEECRSHKVEDPLRRFHTAHRGTSLAEVMKALFYNITKSSKSGDFKGSIKIEYETAFGETISVSLSHARAKAACDFAKEYAYCRCNGVDTRRVKLYYYKGFGVCDQWSNFRFKVKEKYYGFVEGGTIR
jgi:hypothetical protein